MGPLGDFIRAEDEEDGEDEEEISWESSNPVEEGGLRGPLGEGEEEEEADSLEDKASKLGEDVECTVREDKLLGDDVTGVRPGGKREGEGREEIEAGV